jgi:hypothetical protein
MSDTLLTVGFYMKPSKFVKLYWDDLVAYAAARRVRCVKFDPVDDVATLSTLQLDMIVTKLTDDLVRTDIEKNALRISNMEVAAVLNFWKIFILYYLSRKLNSISFIF